MTLEFFETLVLASIRSATPLFIAGMGILLLEKSGVLNLGQEGLVAVGAVVSFIVALETGSYFLALLAALVSGFGLILIFSFLVLVCRADQVVSGLALSIFGVGMAAFISSPYIGESIAGIGPLDMGPLTRLPVVGKILFGHDVFVYCSLMLALALSFFLYRSRAGLILRCVGEDPNAARAMGYAPRKIRFIALLLSAAMVACSGAYLSLVYTPVLSDGLSAGRGWIALALVVFSSHLMWRLGLGAMLFGLMSVLHLALQALGANVSGSLLAIMPYLLTIVALIVFSVRDRKRLVSFMPQAFGQNY